MLPDNQGISEAIADEYEDEYDVDIDYLYSSITSFKDHLFNEALRINWAKMPNFTKYQRERLKQITRYLMNNLKKNIGTSNWQESLTYVDGLIAAAFFNNVNNGGSVLQQNGIIVAGILMHNFVDIYVKASAIRRAHFQHQYAELDLLLQTAFEKKLIRNKDNEIIMVSKFMNIIKACVISFYLWERDHSMHIEYVNVNRVTDCTINMLHAMLSYINNTQRSISDTISNIGSPMKSKENDSLPLGQSFKEVLDRVLCGGNIFSYKQHVLSSSSEFARIIYNHYQGRYTLNESGKALFIKSINIEEFKKLNDGLQDSHLTKKQIDAAFSIFSSTVQDSDRMRRNFLLVSGFLLLSSMFYGLSYNFSNSNGSGFWQYSSFLYSAIAFMLGQKVSAIYSEVCDKRNSFISSRHKIEVSLKRGFLTYDQLAMNNERIDWVIYDHRKMKPYNPPQLIQAYKTMAASWAILEKIDDMPQNCFNRLDMSSFSMTIIIAMCRVFERIGDRSFLLDNEQILKIASSLSEKIKSSIHDEKATTWYSYSVSNVWSKAMRPITGILLDIPQAHEVFDSIDEIIDVSNIREMRSNLRRSSSINMSYDSSDGSLIMQPRIRIVMDKFLKICHKEENCYKNINREEMVRGLV